MQDVCFHNDIFESDKSLCCTPLSINKTYGFFLPEGVLCCLGKVGRKRAQEKGITRKEKSLAQQVLLSETDAAVKNKQVHSRVRKLLDPKN